MQVFKINPDGLKEIKKKSLKRMIPFMTIVAIAAIVIASVKSKTNDADVNVLPVIIPVIGVVFGLSISRGIKRQQALLKSYTLTISDPVITREQFNTPEISIYYREIREISKRKNGCLFIKGVEPGDVIVIPSQIENYSQLENILHNIHPIANREKISFLERYSALAGLLSIPLMLGVYIVDNKIIVALTGTTLVALMSWSFIKLRQNKNIDAKTRRGSWFVFLIIASVIMVMMYKLTGMFGGLF
jgi:hypothetical protein